MTGTRSLAGSPPWIAPLDACRIAAGRLPDRSLDRLQIGWPDRPLDRLLIGLAGSTRWIGPGPPRPIHED